MQIYNSAASPFGARVVLAARIKNVSLDTLSPSGILRTPEYRAINPISKIPVLLPDANTVIVESETIVRYLEDRYPDPTLMPASPEQRARVNMLIRVCDLYVMAPLIRTFRQIAPATRDQKLLDYEIEYWKDGLASLAHFMKVTPERPACGLSMADIALAPALHLCRHIARTFGMDDVLAPHAVITAYYDEVSSHPLIAETFADLTKAQAGH